MNSFANSQATYNGGGRRPRLGWVDHNHNDVGPTRLAVPIEAIRFASMSDTYPAWIRSHFKSFEPTIRRGGRAITHDGFVFLSVNNGRPMRTSYAVDSNAMTWLKRIKCREAEVAYYSNSANASRDLHLSDISLAHLETRKSIVQQGSTAAIMLAALSHKWSGYTESDPLSTVYPATKHPYRCFLGRCSAEMLSWINSALMDTGVNVGVFNSSVEQSMTHSANSRLKIQVADKNYMMGR